MYKREEVIQFISTCYDKCRKKYNITGDHYFNKDNLQNINDRDLKYALGRIIIFVMFPKEFSNIFVAPHKRTDVIINWRELEYDFVDGKLHGKLKLECHNGSYYNPHDIIKPFDENAETFKCKTCSYEGNNSELNSKNWDGKIYYSCPRCHFFLYAEGGVKERRLREIILGKSNINKTAELLKENGYEERDELVVICDDPGNKECYVYNIKGKYPDRTISVKSKFFLREAKDIDIVMTYCESTHAWYQMSSRQWGMARVAPSENKTFDAFKSELLVILKEKNNEVKELANIDYGNCNTCVFKKVNEGSLVCNECKEFGYYHYIDKCIDPENIEVYLNDIGKLTIQKKSVV